MATNRLTPFPLGRRVEPNHDRRSLDFPAPSATVVTKSWIHYGPVLDQGQTSSCTGHAITQATNTKPLHRPYSPYRTHEDAMAVYARATELDPWPETYPPDDAGSDGLSAAKAAKERGWITGYEHAFGLEHTLEALMSGPVIVGTVWLSEMFHPDARGFITASGSESGGHEYELFGVNTQHNYVTGLNSWGNDWALRGIFRMSFDTLDALLRRDGDVVLPIRSTPTGGGDRA